MQTTMSLKQLLSGWVDDSFDDVTIHHLSTHSGQLEAGSLWLATRGVQGKHALDYEPNVQPAAIAYEPPYDNPPAGAIAVPNLSALVSELAARFYGEPNKALCLVGVTGTDGKSSLVHLLSQALNGGMIGTIGYGQLHDLQATSHTTPEALVVQQWLAKFRDLGVAHVAMEVSSHALSQHRVAALDFSIGIFTNLSRDHLDYHKDMEDYFRAKALLFQKPLRAAVINLDDDYGRRLLDEGLIHPQSALVTVSASGKAAPETMSNGVAQHLYAENIEFLPDGIAFTLSRMVAGQTERVAVQSALLARFNVQNLLNVAAVLSALGWELAKIQSALAGLKPVRGRAQKIALKNGASAVIDYAHTPAALENILQGIRPHVRGKLYCVFGCGGDRDRGKRPLMAAAAKRFADVVVITDDNPRTEDAAQIVADVRAGAVDATVIQPRASAIAWAYQRLQAGDALVIAGKGHEDYQIIGTRKLHFSDVEMIEALEQPFAKALCARQVAQICGGEVIGDETVEIQSFTTDSRQAGVGVAFIALRGERFDGADFVADVATKGAVAAIVTQKQAIDLPQIIVSDTKKALWALAQFYRAKAKEKRFVALTGSNGKTSTKEMLARILAVHAPTLATKGNLNNDLGVPLTLLNLNDEQQFAVIEMGANHEGEIAPLAALVAPDVALVTNVSGAHLAGFGGLEGVLRAKTEIYEHSTGAIVLNADSEYFAPWTKRFATRPSFSFGTQDADVKVENLSATGQSFALHFGSKRFVVDWQLLGTHNQMNAAAACACGLALGLAPEKMVAALQNLRLEQSRLTPYRLGVHQLMDDTYNANPASFQAGIAVLSALSGKKVVFAGAMAELGAEADALHQAVGKYAQDCGIDVFHYVAHPNVNADAYAQGFAGAVKHANHDEAQSALLAYLTSDEPVAILVKGSRSAAMERILSSLTLK